MAEVHLLGKEAADEASQCFPTHLAVFTVWSKVLWLHHIRPDPEHRLLKPCEEGEGLLTLWMHLKAWHLLDHDAVFLSLKSCLLLFKNVPLRMPQNGHWLATARISPRGDRWTLLLHSLVAVDQHYELFWIFSWIYSDVKEKPSFFSELRSDNLKWHSIYSAIYCAISAQKSRNEESPFSPDLLQLGQDLQLNCLSEVTCLVIISDCAGLLCHWKFLLPFS